MKKGSLMTLRKAQLKKEKEGNKENYDYGGGGVEI
jgi:hypothetical protein